MNQMNTEESSVDSICPVCGCNPQDEPYCMEATRCPRCGYVFRTSISSLTDERRLELLNNMFEYLNNYGIEYEHIGIDDSTEDSKAYDICLGYIVGLVGCDGDANFFENVLGFTKEELIIEGMEWVYG